METKTNDVEMVKPRKLSAKERVQIELNELNEKMSKLSLFLFSEKALKLARQMRYVMQEQLRHMQDYAHCLQTRLEIWDKVEDEKKNNHEISAMNKGE